MENTNAGLATQTDNQVEAPNTEVAEKKFSQSDLDQAISKALNTRTKNLEEKTKSIEDKYLQIMKEKEAEEEQSRRKDLEKTNKLVDELRLENKRLKLAKDTEKALAEHNALDYLPLFDFDLSDVDNRVEFSKKIQAMIETKVQENVKKEISSPAPVKKTKSDLKSDIPDASWTSEEYKTWKQSKNLK
jgi:hypothetical protein